MIIYVYQLIFHIYIYIYMKNSRADVMSPNDWPVRYWCNVKLGTLKCLATLKSCDTTKQSVWE